MLKSRDGERMIILCAWCKQEMHLRVGAVRHGIKNSNNALCCSQVCTHRYQTYLRDRAPKSLTGETR